MKTPTLTAAIKLLDDMRGLIVEAHDTHIFDEDDDHPDDCAYCAAVKRADAMLAKPFTVEVRYRTNSGCYSKLVPVKAFDMTQAIEIACNKVKRQRGVIRIDGGSVT